MLRFLCVILYKNILIFSKNIIKLLNFMFADRFLSDLKTRKQHAKIYELWRKETINLYLQKNFDLNIYHNQERLRNRPMSDKLNCMSKCEEIMLDKVNNARFIIKTFNKVSVKTEIKFVKDINHKQHNIISDEVQLNMNKEVILFILYFYFIFILFVL